MKYFQILQKDQPPNAQKPMGKHDKVMRTIRKSTAGKKDSRVWNTIDLFWFDGHRFCVTHNFSEEWNL